MACMEFVDSLCSAFSAATGLDKVKPSDYYYVFSPLHEPHVYDDLAANQGTFPTLAHCVPRLACIERVFRCAKLARLQSQ